MLIVRFRCSFLGLEMFIVRFMNQLKGLDCSLLGLEMSIVRLMNKLKGLDCSLLGLEMFFVRDEPQIQFFFIYFRMVFADD